MPRFYTEADYENSIVELFENLGYQHVYAPELDHDFYNPLYEAELVSAMHRINPSMPEDAISDALFKLKNFENAELTQKNSIFMEDAVQTVMTQCELWTDNNEMNSNENNYHESIVE